MSRQSGFSLIEMMVAMAIGLFVVLGAGRLFQMAGSGFNQVTEISDRQQTVRFVTDMLAFDIRSADSIESPALGATTDNLALTFNLGRHAAAYCAPGSASPLDIEHRWNNARKTLVVAASCDEEDKTVSEGIERIAFTRTDAHAVEIVMELTAVDGEEAGPELSFFVTNRAETINARHAATAAADETAEGGEDA